MIATELPPVCKITDVMDYFQISRSSVYRLMKSGELKSYKHGNKPRIKREWIMEYEAKLIGLAEKEGVMK